MDIDFAYYYNATSTANGPFGYGRTASPSLTAQASGSPSLVTLTRGNGARVSFLDNGSGTFIAQTPGVLNTLVKDTPNSLWKETTPDGVVSAYPLDTTGQITSLVYAEDAVGNRHTHAYASGLLQTLQDAVGRKVTFGYASGLLQSVQDWADRRTTFQYDTTSASPRNLLTTVTGPTGCQTGYQYSTFTLAGGTSDWLLSGIVSPNGFGTSYTYDQQKRVTKRTVAGVGTTTYLYQPGVMLTVDVLGHVTTQTTGTGFSLSGMQNAAGALVTFTRNAANQETSRQMPTGAVWTTLYDGSGNVSGQVSPLGFQTTYTHDAFNNLTSVQTADGAIVTNIWGYGGSSFDATGAKRRLQAQVNQLGFITSMSYNGRGQVTAVQSPLGFLSTTGYDNFGNPITSQDPLGSIWTSSFDMAGNVIAKTNPLGATWSATFDNQNRPLTQQDPLGNVSTAGYDSEGNRVVAISPLGFRTSWSFNVFNEPITQVDALGNVSTAIFDGLGRAIASIDALGNRSTTVFDSTGKRVANVDPLGNISSTVFDIASRPIAQINPLGNRSTTVYDLADRATAGIDPLGNRSTTIFDSLNRSIARQNALGFFSTTVFDIAGRRIGSVDALGSRYTTACDPMGRAIASVDPLGRTNTTVYDQASRVIASVDALGFRSTANFDAAGRAISRQDALNRFSTTVFDAANRTIGWVDALNSRGTTNYDAAGRPISSVDPLNRVSTTVFDPLNRATASVSPLGYRTTTNFDADGRTLSWQDALGRLSTNVFDAASRQIASVSPLGIRSTTLYDAGSRPVASQDVLGFLWTSVFDADGRAISNVDPLGTRSSTVFDAIGQTIGQMDGLGNRTSTVYDPVGRVLAQIDARSYRTSFVFDVAGRQIAVVTANGGITTSVFDQRGMLSVSQDPLAALTSYQFDAVGNTVLRIDARNWPTTYTVDALNRTVGTLYIDSTRVTSTFDAAGQPITEQDVTGITSLSWDRDGRQISVVYPAGNALTYSLDPVGNRTLMTDPDGGLTTYSWDAQNRLVGIVNPFAERTTIQYDALDREQRRVLGNGMTVSHTFDSAGRETLLGNFSPTGAALAVFTNTYDALGNRLSVLELDSTRATYAYDPSYQLINEQRSGATPYNTTFVYDGMGNRLLQNNTGVLTTNTFNTANELLTSQTTVASTFYQIDTGGAAASPFLADAFFSSAGTMSTATTGSAVSTTGVTDPAPQACYQSMRTLANPSSTPLLYTLPGLTPGAVYKIRLHWATFSDGSAGQRSINVLINGTPALSHFDVFAAAGGDLKAVVREFSGSADGAGNLVVAITADAGFPLVSAFLNALEVLVPTQSALDINSGGAGVAPFIADIDFSGGSTFSVGTTVSTSGVTNPAPMAVYQTVRFGNFSYALPGLTPSAVYTVRLHFAEIFWTTTGQRVFNVAINGTNVLTSFDIIAAAGGANQAVIQEFTATADGSGNIGVTFTTVVDNAMVNGIEVLGGAPAGLTTFRYDPNGNLLTATDGTGTTIYAWDSENRLLSVASPLNGTETYTYTSDGMRRQKVTSAQTTNFVWDGQNVLQERSVTNVRLAQYTDYPGEWGGLAAQRQGSTSSYYGFDSQSSTRILVSAGGVVTDSYSYKAYGAPLQFTGSTINGSQFLGNAGMYADSSGRGVHRHAFYDLSFARLLAHVGANRRRNRSRTPYGYGMTGMPAAIKPFDAGPPSLDPTSCDSEKCKYGAGRIGSTKNCISKVCANLSNPSTRKKLQRCLDAFNRKSGLQMDLPCIEAWCKSGTTITCLGGPTDVNGKLVCPEPKQQACPKGTPCFGQRVEFPSDCAATMCLPGFHDDNKTYICCNASGQYLIDQCGGGGGKNVPLPKLTCDNGSAIILHELGHWCTDCQGLSSGRDHQGVFNSLGSCLEKAAGC
jgi:YD repeat-containing protein